jgi:hypothetical protein
MTPVFERAKTFHVLDRTATVIGLWDIRSYFSITSEIEKCIEHEM